MIENQCPWKIHWGVGQDSTTQCSKPGHVGTITVTPLPDGRVYVEVTGDPEHSGPSGGPFAYQKITWQAGDRREYTGDWPGPCLRHLDPTTALTLPCTLHTGHHGRCAP